MPGESLRLAPTRSAEDSAGIYDPYQTDSSYSIKDPMPDKVEDLEVEPNRLPLGTAIKRYPKVAAFCVAIMVPVVSYGYDLVIVGSIPGVDAFKADFGERIGGEMAIPGMWLSLFMGLSAAGSAVGSVVAGWLQDRIGRRLGLMAGAVLSAASITLIFFSRFQEAHSARRAVFTAGVTVQGSSVGLIKVVCITYISENCPPALVAPALSLIPAFNLVGQLTGSVLLFAVNGLDGPGGYLAAFGSQWVLAGLSLVLSVFLPESPAYRVREGNEAGARRSAARLFAPRADPDVMLRRTRRTVDEERALHAGVGWAVLLRGANRRRTMVILLANCFQAMFGLDLLGNASVFLQSVGVESGVALLVMVAGIVCGMAGNLAGIWVLGKVGRRPASMATMAVAGLFWSALGFAGFWQTSAAGFFSAGCMVAAAVVCGLGVWPASYAITGEASSLRLRAKSQAVGGLVQEVLSVVMGLALPYVFSRDEGDLRGKTGLIFGALCAIGVVLIFFFIPEMKDRSTMEIDRMFEARVPTRKFGTWKADEPAPASDEEVTGY
ncbi:Sugar (and other) transporter [Geosmithia morbida]|uniref:Sugar (And other) transporter n=1 Tax=Geosmithia morbida TaxID=1094350 RepID=A0A9P4YUY2_9HYPO|nr:Sugar (and other) transporter [Geosmithia morbida]KAF4122515.1 Sugar (and other) transporter [Geosmithia morbida]